VELARHGDRNNEDALDRAANAHERMDDLIEGLLSLATAGKSVDEVDRVSLDGTARRVWSRLETADATLSVNGPDVSALADGDRLEQLLSNLFRNAIEHAGDDVTVRVEIERREDDIALTVADDGPGVPPDQRSQVIERGVSLGGGTGLGLAIVGDIAEAHGWGALCRGVSVRRRALRDRGSSPLTTDPVVDGRLIDRPRWPASTATCTSGSS